MKSKTAKAPIPAERDVQLGVIEAAAVLGIVMHRNNTGMATNPSGAKVRFGQVGNADLTGTMPHGPNKGKRIEIEVKRPGKEPTDAQWHRIHTVNAEGGLSFWTDDPAEALRVLRILMAGGWIEIDPDGKQWTNIEDEVTT